MIFAKIAADLDSHPKIRRAGRDGREVFLFVLRKNALADFNGQIPASHLEPWYLADQLMVTEDDARNGLSRCVTAGLLTESGGRYSISGWDDEWAKRPLSNAERQQKFRASHPNQTANREPEKLSNEASVTKNGSNESNALDKKRRDKKRSEKKKDVPAPPDACLALADLLLAEVLRKQPGNRTAKNPLTRSAWARTLDLVIRIDKRADDRIRAVIAWVFHKQTGPFQFQVMSAESLRDKFDAIELRMARPAENLPPTTNASLLAHQLERIRQTEDREARERQGELLDGF